MEGMIVALVIFVMLPVFSLGLTIRWGENPLASEISEWCMTPFVIVFLFFAGMVIYLYVLWKGRIACRRKSSVRIFEGMETIYPILYALVPSQVTRPLGWTIQKGEGGEVFRIGDPIHLIPQ